MTPEVQAQIDGLNTGKPLVFDGIDVVHCLYNGEPVFFCLDREQDPIQRNNRAGKFYEAPELRWIGKLTKPGATFIDIGANIGNHALYFAKFLKATRVIPIEPNPVAYRLLIANMALNRVTDRVDLTRLGVGLSNRSIGGYAVEQRERNIGGTRMIEGAGDIQVLCGDTLFAGEVPDVIKIDVEGMELDVLEGLETTIATHRPHLLVEVDGENDDAFRDWMTARKYRIVKDWQRYRSNRNYLLTPED